jgi:hypothetical protein
MTWSAIGRSWRLVVALFAYVLWAPLPLVALALGTLLFAARPRRWWEWVLAAATVSASVAWLLLPSTLALDQVLRAWVLLGAMAFTGAALLLEGPFIRRAGWAVGATILGVVALAWATGTGWERLHWEAMRSATRGATLLAAQSPSFYAALEPTVRFVADTFPAVFVLQALTGWALAWQWHCRIASTPLGAPLARLRDFSFSDHWVWGVIVSVALLVIRAAPALKMLAANVLTVLGGLYALRGLGIVVALAAAAGVSPGALAAGGIIAAALIIPLLLIIPALWTVGVGDTWFQFRRRVRPAA